MAKLLEQGGFGCVYYPGLKCKEEKRSVSSKYVTKLVVNDFNAKNELYVGSTIIKIKDYLLHFLPSIDSCYINIGNLDESIINTCKIINHRVTDYLLLIIPYISNIEFARLFENEYTNNKYILLIFMDSYLYLLNSINKLIHNNIVHFDIKIDNVLYGKISHIPLFIDFGISIPMNKISQNNVTEYFYIYAPDNDVWPLEVHVINFLLHKSPYLNNENIYRIVDDVMQKHRALNNFSSEFVYKYRNMFYLYLKKFENFSKYEIINKLLTYYKTWDAYSLSVLYLRIMSHIFRNGFIKSQLTINLSQYLLINISPDPQKRLPLNTAKEMFEKIYYTNESLSQYKSLITSLSL